MPTDELHVVDGSAAGAWLAHRLKKGFGPLVEQQVPEGFARYLRILHPARDPSRKLVTWTEIAQRLGRVAHAEMQWHSLIGSAPHERTNPTWSTGAPALGELEQGSLVALLTICSAHTREPSNCFFGLSTINDELDEIAHLKPNLSLPHRDFIVLQGALDTAVRRLGITASLDAISVLDPAGEASHVAPTATERFIPLAPNLVWPSDQAWCCVTEIDFDSTLIGGSEDLIDELLAEPSLETWLIEASASLAEDADRFNPGSET